MTSEIKPPDGEIGGTIGCASLVTMMKPADLRNLDYDALVRWLNFSGSGESCSGPSDSGNRDNTQRTISEFGAGKMR